MRLIGGIGHSVYVIVTDNAVKIGRAKNALARLASLQTGSPEQLHLFWTFDNLSSAEAKQLEAAVHDVLADKRIRGEWFKVKAEEAIETISSFLNTRVWAARGLARKDTRALIAPEDRHALEEIALKDCLNIECPDRTPRA